MAMSESVVRGVFKVAVGFMVATLVMLAGSIYLSKYYLEQQQQLAASGDLPGAIESARLSARLNPFDSVPLIAEANLLAADGERDEALELIQEATRRDPANNSNFVSLGNFYLNEMGDPEGAIRAYREALDRVPKATDVRSALATALTRSGDLEAAKKEYQALAEADRITLQDLYNLGRIQARTGEPERALETLRDTRERALKRVEGTEGERRTQLEVFAQSVDLAIADALVAQGDYQGAIGELETSESRQAPAILELLRTDPEMYRQTVLESGI